MFKFHGFKRKLSSEDIVLYLRNHNSLSSKEINELLDMLIDDRSLTLFDRRSIGNRILPKYREYRDKIIYFMIGDGCNSKSNILDLLSDSNFDFATIDIILDVNNISDLLYLSDEKLSSLNFNYYYLNDKISLLCSSLDNDLKIEFIKRDALESHFRKDIVRSMFDIDDYDRIIYLYNKYSKIIGNHIPIEYLNDIVIEALVRGNRTDLYIDFYLNNLDVDGINKLEKKIILDSDNVSFSMKKLYCLAISKVNNINYIDDFYSVFDKCVSDNSVNDYLFYFIAIFNHINIKDVNSDLFIKCLNRLLDDKDTFVNNLFLVNFLLRFNNNYYCNQYLINHLKVYVRDYGIESLYNYKGLFGVYLDYLYINDYDSIRNLISSGGVSNSSVILDVLIKHKDLKLIILYSSKYDIPDIYGVISLFINNKNINDMLIDVTLLLLNSISIGVSDIEDIISYFNIKDLLSINFNVIHTYIEEMIDNSTDIKYDKAYHLYRLLFNKEYGNINHHKRELKA